MTADYRMTDSCTIATWAANSRSRTLQRPETQENRSRNGSELSELSEPHNNTTSTVTGQRRMTSESGADCGDLMKPQSRTGADSDQHRSPDIQVKEVKD